MSILPKNGYNVRSSQAVLQYGVGAMVNFPGMTLVTGESASWDQNCIRRIHDERLEKRLGVAYFGQPDGDMSAGGRGIAYARFPKWHSCPRCNRFMPISEWVRNGLNLNRERNGAVVAIEPKCPFCRVKLVPSRFITVCKNGHIDDFPWVEWVHQRAGRNCNAPRLKLIDKQTGSSGLDSVRVECSCCGASTTMRGAFDEGVFVRMNIRCSARHPWKFNNEYGEGNCSEQRVTRLRGASSVYFPITTSSLSIPPYSSLLSHTIESSTVFNNINVSVNTLMDPQRSRNEIVETVLNNKNLNYVNGLVNEIQETTGIDIDKEDVLHILKRKLLPGLFEEAISEIAARKEEYEVLSGRINVLGDASTDFRRIPVGSQLSMVKQVSLIKKLRETQALLGFSRVSPAFKDMPGFVSVKARNNDGSRWYPGYEVRGEGIFIEFDQEKIEAWHQANCQIVDERVQRLQGRYTDTMFAQSNPGRAITAKFVLIHTISHMLLKQLSFECGYSIASLKERVYCDDDMCGILLYTASGDSEGTLGGLVKQGERDRFLHILRKAVESAVYCSNDPVCSLSAGQGIEALNNAACYSCALVPETSCPEERNTLLDRALLVGTVEDRSFGFFSPQLFNDESWIDAGCQAADVGPGALEVDKSATSWIVNDVKFRRLTEEERENLQFNTYCLFVNAAGAYSSKWYRQGDNKNEIIGVRV